MLITHWFGKQRKYCIKHTGKYSISITNSKPMPAIPYHHSKITSLKCFHKTLIMVYSYAPVLSYILQVSATFFFISWIFHFLPKSSFQLICEFCHLIFSSSTIFCPILLLSSVPPNPKKWGGKFDILQELYPSLYNTATVHT